MSTLTPDELNLVRQWFNAVQDLSSGYLEPADYDLAAKIHEALGMRVPNSITSHLSNISATNTLKPSDYGN